MKTSHFEINEYNNIFHVDPRWTIKFLCILQMESSFLMQAEVSMLDLQYVIQNHC